VTESAAWRLERPERLPLPDPAEEAAPFWASLREGELRLQRCAACGALQHPPRAMCASCRSFDFEWMPSSGRGTVYSYVVTHQPIHPALSGYTPFATVEVELEEGARVTSNLLDVPPGEIEIGMPVRLALTSIDDDVTMPYFERVS